MRAGVLALALLAATGAGAEDTPARLAELQTERLRPLDFVPFEAALARLRLPADADAFLRGAGIPELQAAMAAGEFSSETITLWHL